MSKHQIETHKGGPVTCEVGYDPGLDTFFGKVVDGDAERRAGEAEARIEAAEGGGAEASAEDLAAAGAGGFLLWVGTDVEEVKTVEELAEHLAPHASLTHEMMRTLREDGSREWRPPTAHRRGMREFVRATGRAAAAGRVNGRGDETPAGTTERS